MLTTEDMSFTRLSQDDEFEEAYKYFLSTWSVSSNKSLKPALKDLFDAGMRTGLCLGDEHLLPLYNSHEALGGPKKEVISSGIYQFLRWFQDSSTASRRALSHKLIGSNSEHLNYLNAYSLDPDNDFSLEPIETKKEDQPIFKGLTPEHTRSLAFPFTDHLNKEYAEYSANEQSRSFKETIFAAFYRQGCLYSEFTVLKEQAEFISFLDKKLSLDLAPQDCIDVIGDNAWNLACEGSMNKLDGSKWIALRKPKKTAAVPKRIKKLLTKGRDIRELKNKLIQSHLPLKIEEYSPIAIFTGFHLSDETDYSSKIFLDLRLMKSVEQYKDDLNQQILDYGLESRELIDPPHYYNKTGPFLPNDRQSLVELGFAEKDNGIYQHSSGAEVQASLHPPYLDNTIGMIAIYNQGVKYGLAIDDTIENLDL